MDHRCLCFMTNHPIKVQTSEVKRWTGKWEHPMSHSARVTRQVHSYHLCSCKETFFRGLFLWLYSSKAWWAFMDEESDSPWRGTLSLVMVYSRQKRRYSSVWSVSLTKGSVSITLPSLGDCWCTWIGSIKESSLPLLLFSSQGSVMSSPSATGK